MPSFVISLTEEDVSEIKVIVMDEDKKEAFNFLKKKNFASDREKREVQARC